jgi:hypothetical protein
MNKPRGTESQTRQGWIYALKLVFYAFAILLCIATLKFFNENRLAPSNIGLGGVVSRPKLDLLFIGSSHTRKSIDMKVVERITGINNSFQVSYDGADLTVMSQIIDYLSTEPDHCPQYLVVEAYSAFLAREPILQDPRYFSDAPPPLKMAIIRSYLSEQRGLSSVLDIFALVVNRGNDEILSYPIYAQALKLGSYKGGRANFYFPGTSREAFTKLKADLKTDTANPAQLRALGHILEVTRDHNIQLIFVDPPLPEPVSTDAGIQKLKSDFINILSARHVSYIDGDRGFAIDDPTLFSDLHLSSRGRDEFTPRISEKLREWIAFSSTVVQ